MIYDHILHSENEPPVFRSTPLLYAFKSQRLRFEVPVTDPESKMLTYKFFGESHSMEISSAGVITWFPQEYDKVYTFTVKATDPCGLFTQETYFVNVSRCQCEGQNGGQCVWEKNTNGTLKSVCKCPNGCTGPK